MFVFRKQVFLLTFFFAILSEVILKEIISPSTWKGLLAGKRDSFDKAIVSDLEFIISVSFLISSVAAATEWISSLPPHCRRCCLVPSDL